MAKPHSREIRCSVRGYAGRPSDASLGRIIRPVLAATIVFCGALATPRSARAQEEAATEVTPATAEPVPSVPVPTSNLGTDASGAAVTTPVEPGLTADRKTEDLKPEPKVEPPVLKIGIGLRTGLAMVLNSSDSDQVELSLNDGLADQANLRPYMTAQMNESLSFFTSLEIGTRNTLGLDILDAIVQIKVIKEFQIWMGQHIGANDRNNMNGPFFGNGWNFAIGVPSYPFDSGARDRGVTFWGLIAEGRFKYHASILDVQPCTSKVRTCGQALENIRYGGRVTLHLLEPEDFYYNSGTYFGKKDVLALGAVVNYQKGVAVAGMPGMPNIKNDFLGYSFDLLFEKNLGSPGTITFEAGYWDFSNVEAGYAPNQGTKDLGTGVATTQPVKSFFASASWLEPNKTGIGQLQPNLRWQMSDYKAAGPNEHVIDVGLGYIIDGFNNRWYINYRRVNGAIDQDIAQVGAQFMM